MATKVFTVVDKERWIGHVSTYSKNVAISEGLRLFGNRECFMVFMSWLIDEWVDMTDDGDADDH